MNDQRVCTPIQAMYDTYTETWPKEAAMASTLEEAVSVAILVAIEFGNDWCSSTGNDKSSHLMIR